MTALCRGCGGDGLSPYLNPRRARLAKEPVIFPAWIEKIDNFPDNDRRVSHRVRAVQVAASHDRISLPYTGGTVVTQQLPLADALREIERLESGGWRMAGLLAFDKSFACDWCAGTGTPSLSVHAMEVASR